jgi:hypothetical protein
VGRRVGRRLFVAPGGEVVGFSERVLELEENCNGMRVGAIVGIERIHLPVTSEVVEGLDFAAAPRLGATFFAHFGFLSGTVGTLVKAGEDLSTKLLVREIGESGRRDGVESDESAVGENLKESRRAFSFMSRPSFGFPTARS